MRFPDRGKASRRVVRFLSFSDLLSSPQVIAIRKSCLSITKAASALSF